jgi:hypothetical protein
MCSESGQLIRVLLLHEEAERFVDELNGKLLLCNTESYLILRVEGDNGRYPVDQLQELETKLRVCR